MIDMWEKNQEPRVENQWEQSRHKKGCFKVKRNSNKGSTSKKGKIKKKELHF